MAKLLRNNIYRITLAILFIAIFVMDGTAANAILRINILDGDNKSPIEYAAIKLTSKRNQVLGGYSDSKGMCTLNIAAGTWEIEASMVGYRPTRTTIKVVRDERVTLSLFPMESLDEVVVTARESLNATSASTIDTTAMRHLQPSSFTDILELLPGGVTKDPAMGGVNTISLREASGITPTDDYATAALGTSFVVDGVRINTDADLQMTPDNNQSSRISTGKGVDMRSLSTDDIESVEIVRGIPSVEYGEITSGTVNIKRKSGISRLEARFKADTQSQLLYVGKGFAIKKVDNWVINTGIDYFDSKIDPRNNRENFKRVTGSLRSDKRWHNQNFTLRWNTGLNYNGTFEKDDNDPDIAVNNTIDYYKNNKHSIFWNNALTYTPVINNLLQELSLTSGINYSYEQLTQQKHVSPSRIMPLPVSLTEGSNYIGYLPMLYLADYAVDGRPFTATLKGAARFRFGGANYASVWKVGAEWDMSKNYGKGAIYDLSRPLTAGNNTRPRAFREIPAMHHLSAYIESETKWYFKRHTLTLIAGVRETQLLNLDKRYALRGKPYFDPRFNAVWDLPPVYIKNTPVNIEIAGGAGWHTKMPVASYLYPDRLYTDFEQLNYFHNTESYRVMNVMTYINDLTNYSLRAARNFKWEVRTDFRFKGNRVSLTYFRENMTGGFRKSGFVYSYKYNRYDATGFDAGSYDRAPIIDELPYTEETYLAVRSKVTNGSRTFKEGIEYTLQSKRFPKVNTRITISGAYFRTINSNSQSLWYKPTTVINGKELQYVGLYDDTDGSRYSSCNTNFMLDTDIKRLGLNFSISVQNLWFTSRQTLWRDGVPTHYMDINGDISAYTEESKRDPYLAQLLRNFSEGSFVRLTVPSSTTINLKATKHFWNNRIGLALYVNRLVAIEPDYQRYGLTIRRFSTPYFGMELNLKL